MGTLPFFGSDVTFWVAVWLWLTIGLCVLSTLYFLLLVILTRATNERVEPDAESPQVQTWVDAE